MTTKALFYMFCLLISLSWMLSEKERKWYIKYCGVVAVLCAFYLGVNL